MPFNGTKLSKRMQVIPYLCRVKWGHLRPFIPVLSPVTEKVASIHEVQRVVKESVARINEQEKDVQGVSTLPDDIASPKQWLFVLKKH